MLRFSASVFVGDKMKKTLADFFLDLVVALEKNRGYRIGGFALVEKTGRWKVIQPNGKAELLEKETKND